MRTVTALAAIALAASLLTACGGSGSSAYCKDLKSDKTYFDSLSGGSDTSKLGEAYQRMHSLAGEAPDAVKKDWKTIDDALTTVDKALKDAGITFADLGKLQKGETPAGADVAKLQALVPKLSAAFGGSDVTKASKAIEKHAKSSCKVDLT
jgi:cytochrome c556